VTISLEASRTLNTIESIQEGSTQLCGSRAGAQIKGGISINKGEFGCLIEIKPDVSAGGVAFYEATRSPPPSPRCAAGSMPWRRSVTAFIFSTRLSSGGLSIFAFSPSILLLLIPFVIYSIYSFWFTYY
jgi:hypothetical protein